MSTLAIVRTYGSLIRFSHTIFALPFALAAVVLALRFVDFSWSKLGWIGVCIVSARTAAMAFNRLIDRHIDAQNPRTQDRELPRGALSVHAVRLLVLVSSAAFLLGASQLGQLPFLLSPLALGLALGYSYTKRFTAWCHVVLGLAIAFAPGGAWIAMNAPLDVAAPWFLVLGVATWVAGFDILYSLSDQNFDRNHGLRSIPVRWGIVRSLNLSSGLHMLTVLCLAGAGYSLSRGLFYYLGVGLIAILLLIEHRMLKPHDLSKLQRAFFDINGYVSVLFFACVVLDHFFKW